MAVCEEWDHRGRYDTSRKAESVLAGLGFGPADMERDCSELSGGCRCASPSRSSSFAAPTSSSSTSDQLLDLERGRGSRSFSPVPGYLVMVAHDRYFLDVTVDHIAECSTAG